MKKRFRLTVFFRQNGHFSEIRQSQGLAADHAGVYSQASRSFFTTRKGKVTVQALLKAMRLLCMAASVGRSLSLKNAADTKLFVFSAPVLYN